MATLHKFKLLATRCTLSGSPTASPGASPAIRLRRRKTLRMLLRRIPSARSDDKSPDPREAASEGDKSRTLRVGNKLKDLFVSSPPGIEEAESENAREGLLVHPSEGRRRNLRPLSATIRQRLMRRAWRPVLGSIPE
ncbi:hypothetical protein M569_02217 [Genlisea aurea]|uniref:Uncharacterized protein n=1 Tax=Genlisea aurea TaxID=192259 RepID=S8CYM5_9LAMI|nr:hypothetical protein M569_02217 [Genlisea aurea]